MRLRLRGWSLSAAAAVSGEASELLTIECQLATDLKDNNELLNAYCAFLLP